MMDYQTVLDAVIALPIEEQARLVAEVQDRLDDEDDFVLTDELTAELEHRIKESEQNPGRGRPWREVLAELRKEFEN